MSAAAISRTQFWHSRSGPAAPYSQQKRGAERPSEGSEHEANSNHVGYVLRDGQWVPRRG